jgi:hypothetical protein
MYVVSACFMLFQNFHLAIIKILKISLQAAKITLAAVFNILAMATTTMTRLSILVKLLLLYIPCIDSSREREPGNILANLYQYSALYVRHVGCMWSEYEQAYDDDGENRDGDENWYQGRVPRAFVPMRLIPYKGPNKTFSRH